METTPKNLFDGIPADLPEELFSTLHESDRLRIERIVSRGHASPSGFWYDQEDDEWVVILSGDAVIEFEGGEIARLGPGSYLNIPAHARHRVVSTSRSEDTVWLAIHYGN